MLLFNYTGYNPLSEMGEKEEYVRIWKDMAVVYLKELLVSRHSSGENIVGRKTQSR
jgi:hypothetical protein